ncbi:lamin tail domain-containing protein [Aeromicrobium fastidiosum]|uniref:lamin tail domain-containing protein n=1 Tax=Aeromicrobium fastidiosum TaxID=52699 RepID=UPI0020233331|nr:lamin tail domain-containing protein [Aeromicrobium fastidiosum]MCL8249943.1 lamin tail domain-containing protein [Aeromicrobium fastidiosum]
MPASPRRPRPSRTLGSIPLLSCLVLVATVVLGAPAGAATPDPSSVKINEVRSNPGVDFVELVNTGSEPIDISGWKAVDSGAAQVPVAIAPASTSIAPGGLYSFEPDAITGGFGLGASDSITILLPDGTTTVATYAWTTHRTPSFGRCPGGADLVLNALATKDAANDCPAPDPKKVRINEVRSNPGVDFVELLNTGALPVDISGWKAVDSGAGQAPVDIAQAGTSIAPGGYFSVEPDTITGGFGLGGSDSITILQADGTTVVDTYAWTSHRTPSFGRCPAGTGDLVANVVATKGAKNSCPAPAGAENLKINEVESDPTDRIELVNNGTAPLDVSGYVLRDESDTSLFTIPSGTTIGAGAVLVFDVKASFGLGKGDSARLYAPFGETLLDSTTWPADTHATTWGRCPNGIGDFTTTASTIGLPNQCAAPADPTTVVRINEVESNGDKVADWVELTNTGTSTVDVSGWKILDADPSHAATPVVVPAKTTIAPGAFLAIYTEVNQSPGFGLGGVDSATLYLADGTTKVDSYEWTTHAATTYGRCPDGSGDFRTTTTSTRGASNACSLVRLNEIGPDWVELVNIGDTPLDVSGWTLKDSGDAGAYTFPTGTTVPAKGYRVVEAGTSGFGFSLGAGDSVRLLGADGAVVESYTWTNPAAVTYGRCKDGVGDFVDTRAATKGAANACPGLDTEPWPGSQDVRTADLASTFTQDLSGLAFDPEDPDVLWAAQNKLGTLFKLVRDGQTWVPATTDGWGAGKTPTYLDGTGAPDTEGLTIGPDGFVYAAAERNNAASGVSRMSILRYAPDTADTTLRATDEWNLTSQIPAAGANLGLEGVTWVPDSFLVAGGFVDQSTSKPYVPSDYPLHGTGLYVVAVEDTGALHAFALDSTGGTSHRIATISSGFAHLADVTFDAERQRLWAVTDDTHDGKTSLLQLKGGVFTVAEAYDRPVTMPNLNNEGFALAPQSRCVDGLKEVVWSDDGDTGGHSIRTGTIACTPATTPVEPQPEPTPVPVDRVAPVVTIAGVAAGRLYVGDRPAARCTATDETSGPVACRLTTVVTPKRTTLTARATDAAGNTGTRSVTYRTLAYEVRGATYRGGKFTMERGRRYTLDGTVEASGRVLGPARLGTVAKPSARLKDGRATVRVPRSATVGSTWKILVVEKSRSYTIKVRVAR